MEKCMFCEMEDEAEHCAHCLARYCEDCIEENDVEFTVCSICHIKSFCNTCMDEASNSSIIMHQFMSKPDGSNEQICHSCFLEVLTIEDDRIDNDDIVHSDHHMVQLKSIRQWFLNQFKFSIPEMCLLYSEENQSSNKNMADTKE